MQGASASNIGSHCRRYDSDALPRKVGPKALLPALDECSLTLSSLHPSVCRPCSLRLRRPPAARASFLHLISLTELHPEDRMDNLQLPHRCRLARALPCPRLCSQWSSVVARSHFGVDACEICLALQDCFAHGRGSHSEMLCGPSKLLRLESDS